MVELITSPSGAILGITVGNPMTKRQSIRLVKIYLGYVLGGAMLFYCAGLALLFLFDTTFTRAVFGYVLDAYLIGIVVLAPMVGPAFLSFTISSLQMGAVSPKGFQKLIDSLPFLIWDALKDPESRK